MVNEVDIVKKLEDKFGVKNWSEIGKKEGYLYNIKAATLTQNTHTSDTSGKGARSGVHLYFINDEGQTWRTSIAYRPYFFVLISNKSHTDSLIQALQDKFDKYEAKITHQDRIDLSAVNHLSPTFSQSDQKTFLKICFPTVDLLTNARDELHTLVNQNKTILNTIKERNKFDESGNSIFLNLSKSNHQITHKHLFGNESVLTHIIEIYEANVRYITRVCIDTDIRCGCWYVVERIEPSLDILPKFHIVDRAIAPPLSILAWDIECSKEPLKFPSAEKDEIILISYVFNGQGYLIVNREGVCEDISEFTFAPTQSFSGPGSFKIFNEPNERNLLLRFFQHIVRLRPHIFATYNGDNFDIPFVNRRSQLNGISMEYEIGISKKGDDQFTGQTMLALDCFRWVERDSYLPNGSRGLKAVCKIKLQFDPVEVDAEEMVPLAQNEPQKLAVYSVSDAVATYYLYEMFIHRFILALCIIIPLPPEDVLRQGSGTLCENLLMAQAYKKNIIFPNKHQTVYNSYWKDPKTRKLHFIYDDSYVGGKVESLKCGIYRDDLEEAFTLNTQALCELRDKIKDIIYYWLHIEVKQTHLNIDDIENYEDVYNEIYTQLTHLISQPNPTIFPRIYHLDVAAMYPNIILTHRLQPPSIVNQSVCANCYWKKEANICQKPMKWNRKLEISPIEKGHILTVVQDLKSRIFPIKNESNFTHKTLENVTHENGDQSDSDIDEEVDTDTTHTHKYTSQRLSFKSWPDLTERQQHMELEKSIKELSLKTHKKTKIQKEVEEESIVCQRENGFYVDTVRLFRDRRYIYKATLKASEAEKKELLKDPSTPFNKIKEIEDKILLNDSLQLAHKCILNSFYGYVKRGGSRWYSQEIGAIVTHTGAEIINGARELLDKVGIPIELDTDGIWCMLPLGFPETYEMKLKAPLPNGKRKLEFEFPTSMLNVNVAKDWTNHQYLEAVDETKYKNISKNEVFFELDGPWKAMFLPASEKSNDLLKKRYVIFNHKQGISELKGFEIKRRGELRIIQNLQSELFTKFLGGHTKLEAYNHVAKVGKQWRDLLETHAASVPNDDELIELIVAKNVLNKPVNSHPNAKSMGITAAKRLSALLNNTSYIEDSPVFTQFIVSRKPIGAECTSRAIPIQVFKAEPNVRYEFLRKWLDDQKVPTDLRELIDWEYYKQRLDVQLLKLICIPAIKQGLINPIPEVVIPDWLKQQMASLDIRQSRITHFFQPTLLNNEVDIEDIGKTTIHKKRIHEDKENLQLNIKHTHSTHTHSTHIDPINTKIAKKENNQSTHTLKILAKNNKNLFYKDFTNWLKFQLLDWKAIRYELRQLKAPDISSFITHKYVGIKKILQKVSTDDLSLILNDVCHIIDFTIDDQNPGLFHTVLSPSKSNNFFTLTIDVNRHIYINQLTPWTTHNKNTHITVHTHTHNFILPRGVQQHHIIELEMNEQFYQQKKNSLAATFYQNVVGVYETEIPLWFDFLSRFGSTIYIHTTDPTLAITPNGHISSKYISSSNTKLSTSPYLPKINFIYINIFHVCENNNTQDINRIFISFYSDIYPDGSCVYIGGLKQISIEQFDCNKLWSENIKNINISQLPSQFGTHTPPILNQNCNKILGEFDIFIKKFIKFEEEKNNKLIIYLYSTLERENIGSWVNHKKLGILEPNNIPEKFKRIPRRNFAIDSFHTSMSLLSDNYTHTHTRLELARFSNIPVGYLLKLSKFECFQRMYDISYAHSLRQYQCILWASPNGFDLGHPTLKASSHSDFDLYFNNKQKSYTQPGVYRGYSVEFYFGETLLFNATRLSHQFNPEYNTLENWKSHLDDFLPSENNNLIGQSNTHTHTLTHTHLPQSGFVHYSEFHPTALRILSLTLDNLSRSLSNLHTKMNTHTFEELSYFGTHFVSWISDPNSLLFDPALYRKVIYNGRLYLNHLINEFSSKFGVLTVFGDLKHLVVYLGEFHINNGRQILHTALTHFSSKESIFNLINFDSMSEYVAMIQLDDTHFIRYRNYEVPNEQNVYENLTFLEALPYAVDTLLRQCMYTLTISPIKKIILEFQNNKNNEILASANLFKIQQKIKFFNKQIWFDPKNSTSYYTLLEYLTNPHKFIHYLDSSSTIESYLEFPNRIGSKIINNGNWRYEIVKFVTNLLKIDKSLEVFESDESADAFDERRHELFTLAGESEYSKSNEKYSSCLYKLVIDDVKCQICNSVNSVDLIENLEEEEEGDYTVLIWRCPNCNEEYLHDDIEMGLLNLLEKFYYALQAQDFVCNLCSSIHSFHRLLKCRCGGDIFSRLDQTKWGEFYTIIQELSIKGGFLHIQQSLSQLALALHTEPNI